MSGRDGKLRPRAALGNLTLFACTILITFLALEVGVRLLISQNPDVYDGEKFLLLHPPPGEPQTLVPHSAGKYTGVPVRVNSIGLRDREVAMPKPEAVFRVLAIGDSVTFGFGVRLEETYVKRLEQRLNAGLDQSPARVEVVNAGIPGTGILSYLQFLESKGRMLQPDLILVGIVLNDIFDYDAVFAPVETQERKVTLVERLRPINRAMLLHSHLYLLVYTRVKSVLYSSGVVDINEAYDFDFLTVQPPSEAQARAWVSSLKRLGRLIEATKRLRVPVVLVVFPMEFQLDVESLELYRHELGLEIDARAVEGIPQQRLAEFARTQNVPLVDLLPRFRGSRSEALFLRTQGWLDWAHPSAAGHNLAADEILTVLEELDLVRPVSTR